MLEPVVTRYRAASCSKARRVVAKIEWHPGELYPRVEFIVTKLARPAERVVVFYNLGNFLRTLALHDAVRHWSLMTLRDHLVDWRQDRAPRALYHVPDGRGCHPEATSYMARERLFIRRGDKTGASATPHKR